MRARFVLLLVAACGSSSKTALKDPQQAERDAARARRDEIEKSKPASPYEVRDRVGYRPADRCGQGPYRMEIDSLAAKYAERHYVYACGKHSISGNYRITKARKHGSPDTDESAFGFGGRDNDACKGEVVAVASASSTAGGGGGGKGTGGKTTSGGGASAAPAMTIKAASLARTTSIPEDCVRTHVLDTSYTSAGDYVALDAKITIDIWSDEPNDFDGLVFVIERSAVNASMTPEKWQAYQTAMTAYYDAYSAAVDADLEAGRSTLIDTSVKTPPPPPARAETPSPRPSKNARWIPGYWHYEETKFHWIAGLWDVPEADVKQEMTVVAPTPPPVAPPKQDEPQDPAPTKTAVWAPGSWQWDGRAYVWVAGAWRVPPDAQSTWQQARWSTGARGSVYIPGGWKVRVRLGR